MSNIVDRIIFDPLTRAIRAVSRGGGTAEIVGGDPRMLSPEVATRYGLFQYTPGTAYRNGIIPVFTGGGGSANTTVSRLIPYQTRDGAWRLRFNVQFLTVNATSIAAVLNGITTAGETQSIVGSTLNQAFSIHWARIQGGGGTFEISAGSTNSNGTWLFSGDILLAAKPTWAW